ncbi:MAG: DUF4157 domain-containing protein [Pyrinomonadaceae bacterium]|nr:DUF4157 domain-containing protein [Pyrinomonadaceae bacterium]
MSVSSSKQAPLARVAQPKGKPPSQHASGILQRKCACGTHTLAGGDCESCAQEKNKLQRLPLIQTKLKVGDSNDPLEQAADRIADEALADAPSSSIRSAPLNIQRYQGQAHTSSDVAPASVDNVLAGSGCPLDSALQQDMGQRFGYDFSRVRVHSDHTAHQSAREMNALAYTAGHNIVFGAGQFAPATPEGRHLIAHELAHVVQQSGAERIGAVQSNERLAPLPTVGEYGVLQRKCGPTELGAPAPACTPSQQGVAGWQFMFKVNCDEMLPGEEANIEKFKPGDKLSVHGFASRDGDPGYNDALSCHRANKVAELLRMKRADCPIVGVFHHGASPAPGMALGGSRKFFRSVIVANEKPTPESGELWLDPGSIINQGRALLARAKQDPTTANLDVIAARRAQLKSWLESTPTTLAPTGAQLTRRNLDDYRRFSGAAEKLWSDIDQLLAIHKHTSAATDTYNDWAKGTGTHDQGPELHAKNVPTGAKYHIDIFGEGFFPGAINIGMATRTSTTGVSGSRVPNLIYRKFSGSKANQIPIASHTADLITSENGPIGFPGLADEIARIIAPGGTIILYNPVSEEDAHDEVAKKVGGKVTKTTRDDILQTTIVAPMP